MTATVCAGCEAHHLRASAFLADVAPLDRAGEHPLPRTRHPALWRPQQVTRLLVLILRATPDRGWEPNVCRRPNSADRSSAFCVLIDPSLRRLQVMGAAHRNASHLHAVSSLAVLYNKREMRA